ISLVFCLKAQLHSRLRYQCAKEWPKVLNPKAARVHTSRAFLLAYLFLVNLLFSYFIFGSLRYFSFSNFNFNWNITPVLNFALTHAFCFSSKSSPIPARISRSGSFSSASIHFCRKSLKDISVLFSIISLLIGQSL